VAKRWLGSLLVLFAIIVLAGAPHAQQPAPAPAKGGDLELVQKLLTVRRDYQKTLEQLRIHYYQVNDMERMRWAEEELKQYHRIPKHAFILELDVPPPNLNGQTNVPEANKLFTWAMQYKDKGFGVDYTDNQRRAELLFQEILTKYPQSDKIADVAYQLGDIYESKAYRMYYRAVEYYQRCYQWNPKTTHEARIRAARIYDKQLHNRNRAIELYREVTTHETDPRRIQEAQKRIAELSATK
jgi:tetratricopeptide (TPR) repeat protein